MRRRQFKKGDWVVYRRSKHTSHPGPRARDVAASPHGDLYSYVVDKFWIVADVLADGNILLKTRRGKSHLVSAQDLNLRHATWWVRFRHRERFTTIQQQLRESN
jgi:hypothetical protein